MHWIWLFSMTTVISETKLLRSSYRTGLQSKLTSFNTEALTLKRVHKRISLWNSSLLHLYHATIPKGELVKGSVHQNNEIFLRRYCLTEAFWTRWQSLARIVIKHLGVVTRPEASRTRRPTCRPANLSSQKRWNSRSINFKEISSLGAVHRWMKNYVSFKTGCYLLFLFELEHICHKLLRDQ